MKGLGTLGRLGLEGLLLFMYPNYPTTFSSGLFTAWRAVERFYAEGFGFLFDNTSLCCHCVYLSSLNLCLLFSAVDVILIGLDCLPILFLACVHFSYTYCLS